MKLTNFKTTVISSLCLVVVGFSGISWGHEVNPGQSLGSSSILNVDVYSVSCFTAAGLIPKRFVGKVQKTGAEATAALRVSVGRVSTVATGASASTTSAAGAASGWAQVAAINGSTHVAVISHDKAVANTYTAFLHCETPNPNVAPLPESAGIEAGTTIAGGNSSGGGAPIVNQ